MFDLVTKYKRVIQVFLGLIALTFATWGIESYTRFRGAGDAVASVNGMKISQREFADELRRQQDQIIERLFRQGQAQGAGFGAVFRSGHATPHNYY